MSALAHHRRPVSRRVTGYPPRPLHWSKQSPRRWPLATRLPLHHSNWRSPTPRSQTAASCSSRRSSRKFGRRTGRCSRAAAPGGAARDERRSRRQLRDILVETVAHGTAAGAELPSFVVAGKTGTARRYNTALATAATNTPPRSSVFSRGVILNTSFCETGQSQRQLLWRGDGRPGIQGRPPSCDRRARRRARLGRPGQQPSGVTVDARSLLPLRDSETPQSTAPWLLRRRCHAGEHSDRATPSASAPVTIPDMNAGRFGPPCALCTARDCGWRSSRGRWARPPGAGTVVSSRTLVRLGDGS